MDFCHSVVALAKFGGTDTRNWIKYVPMVLGVILWLALVDLTPNCWRWRLWWVLKRKV